MGWIPIIGQALAAVLGTIALVASLVSLLGNLYLKLTGYADWSDVAWSALGVAAFGLGRIAMTGFRSAWTRELCSLSPALSSSSRRCSTSSRDARSAVGGRRLVPDEPLVPLSHVTQLNMPDTWAGVPNVASDAAWAGDVAAMLCDGEEAQALVAAKLADGHADLITEAHLVVGVWVPDRAVPDIAGVFFLDWVVPTDDGLEANRRNYRSLVDPDRRTDHVTYRRLVKELDVPAGPALMVHEVIARPLQSWKRTVQENIIYTVFPPGCSDAVTLALVSYAPEFGDVLSHDAAVGADSLRVALTQPQWG